MLANSPPGCVKIGILVFVLTDLDCQIKIDKENYELISQLEPRTGLRLESELAHKPIFPRL
jgi:hypothetical protein